MQAINSKTHDAIQANFGGDYSLSSEDGLIAGVLQEIAAENKVPFRLSEDSAIDNNVLQYFANSYAYVKFSK